jgi:drug/metabolite transporter (DMT)-like permease
MTRILGALLVLTGVVLLARAGFVLLHPLTPLPPSLCGCEFDEALRQKGQMPGITSCIAGGVAVVAGILLARRHRFALVGVGAWLVAMTAIPWTYQLHPPMFPIDHAVIIWSAVFGGPAVLAFALQKAWVRRLTCVGADTRPRLR